MSPTRRQLLQGIAALALSPKVGPALAASPMAQWCEDDIIFLHLADMPPGWDVYDEIDFALMRDCGPNGYQIGAQVEDWEGW